MTDVPTLTPTLTPPVEKRLEAASAYELYDRLFMAEGDGIEEAYDAYDILDVTLVTDDAGKIVRCGITGVPLVAADDTVLVLRSALPAK